MIWLFELLFTHKYEVPSLVRIVRGIFARLLNLLSKLEGSNLPIFLKRKKKRRNSVQLRIFVGREREQRVVIGKQQVVSGEWAIIYERRERGITTLSNKCARSTSYN